MTTKTTQQKLSNYINQQFIAEQKLIAFREDFLLQCSNLGCSISKDTLTQELTIECPSEEAYDKLVHALIYD